MRRGIDTPAWVALWLFWLVLVGSMAGLVMRESAQARARIESYNCATGERTADIPLWREADGKWLNVEG